MNSLIPYIVCGIVLSISIFIFALFFSERKQKQDMAEYFKKYIANKEIEINDYRNYVNQIIEQEKEKTIVHEDKRMILVGRWMCMNCNQLYVLNYYQEIYTTTPDGLDITGSYRKYHCGKCGNHIMKLQFMKIRATDATKPWEPH